MKKEPDEEKKFFTKDEMELYDKFVNYKEKLLAKRKVKKKDLELEIFILKLENVYLKLEETALTREIVYRMEDKARVTKEEEVIISCEKCGSRIFIKIIDEQKNPDGFMCNVLYCTKCKIKTISPIPNNWHEYYIYKLSMEDNVKWHIKTNPGMADTISEAQQKKHIMAYTEIINELIKEQKKKNENKKRLKMAEENFEELKKEAKEVEIAMLKKFGSIL